MNRTRVLVVEDHTVVRQGLRAMLEAERDLEVCGEAGDGISAVEQAGRLRPDVVLLDMSLPGQHGIDAAKAIKEKSPSTAILVLSMYASRDHVRPAVRAGASGYLLKGAGVADVVAGIRAVAKGDRFFSPSVAAFTEAGAQREENDLTPREQEVLRMVSDGCSSQEIAKKLDLSVKTVEGHRSRIMVKLDVSNVAELVREAIRLGLVHAGPDQG